MFTEVIHAREPVFEARSTLLMLSEVILGVFMRFIKQFGLQRSGTNALKALVELNFSDVTVLSGYLGDKHAETSWDLMLQQGRSQDPKEFGVSHDAVDQILREVEQKTLPIIINLKDPVSWVNSYCVFRRR